MEHLSTSIDKWFLNKLISYRAQLNQAKKIIPLERAYEYAELQDAVSFVETECLKRNIKFPDIT